MTKLGGVSWEGHEDQHQLYEAVTEYVREGYNQAMREKKSYVGLPSAEARFRAALG